MTQPKIIVWRDTGRLPVYACICHQIICNGAAYIGYTAHNSRKRSYTHLQFGSNCAQENTAHGIKSESAALRSEIKIILHSSCRRDWQLAESVLIDLDYFLINHLCNFFQVKYLPNLQYREKFAVTPNAQFASEMLGKLLFCIDISLASEMFS